MRTMRCTAPSSTVKTVLPSTGPGAYGHAARRVQDRLKIKRLPVRGQALPFRRAGTYEAQAARAYPVPVQAAPERVVKAQMALAAVQADQGFGPTTGIGFQNVFRAMSSRPRCAESARRPACRSGRRLRQGPHALAQELDSRGASSHCFPHPHPGRRRPGCPGGP